MVGFMEGSIFYDIGGFTMPFYVNLGCLLISSPLKLIFLPSNKQITEF